MILLHFKCLSKTSINQAIRAYEVEKISNGRRKASDDN